MGFEFRVWPATTSFIYCPMLSKPIPACISCDPYISCDGAKKKKHFLRRTERFLRRTERFLRRTERFFYV